MPDASSEFVKNLARSILVDSNASKLIDFLSLDVEGSELDVVDHGIFRFRYLPSSAIGFSTTSTSK
jgi:hypothetical protein